MGRGGGREKAREISRNNEGYIYREREGNELGQKCQDVGRCLRKKRAEDCWRESARDTERETETDISTGEETRGAMGKGGAKVRRDTTMRCSVPSLRFPK